MSLYVLHPGVGWVLCSPCCGRTLGARGATVAACADIWAPTLGSDPARPAGGARSPGSLPLPVTLLTLFLVVINLMSTGAVHGGPCLRFSGDSDGDIPF